MSTFSPHSASAINYTYATHSIETAQELQRWQNKPERNLLAALIERTMLDLKLDPSHPLHKAAWRWLFRVRSENEPWTLEWVALHLDLCPVTFRQAVQSYSRKVMNGEISLSEKVCQKYRKQGRIAGGRTKRPQDPFGSPIKLPSHRD